MRRRKAIFSLTPVLINICSDYFVTCGPLWGSQKRKCMQRLGTQTVVTGNTGRQLAYRGRRLDFNQIKVKPNKQKLINLELLRLYQRLRTCFLFLMVIVM